MILEELSTEIERIMGEIKNIDPATTDYRTASTNLHEIVKILHEELDARDSDLDRSTKRELDKAAQKLKETELEFKRAAEDARRELDKKEAEEKQRQAIRDTKIGVIKVLIMIAGTILSIIVTGRMEANSILPQKAFSWAQKLFTIRM